MSPRLHAVALCLVLGTAAVAGADGASPRLSLSRVLDGKRQALVLDRQRGDYAVLKVGDSVQGFRVAAIEADRIVLEGGAPSERYVIALAEAAADPAGPAPTDQVLDPYPFGSATEVVDPYAPGIPQVSAPAASRVGPHPSPAAGASPASASAAATAPATASATASATATATPASAAAPVSRASEREPAANRASPGSPHAAGPAIGHIAELARAPAPGARKARRARPRTHKVRIARAELEAALADFARLGREVVVEPTAAGIALREVAPAGFFHRVGLRAGDTVTEVAGRRIATVDDAAEVYVVAQAARSIDVALIRDGAPVRLAIAVR